MFMKDVYDRYIEAFKEVGLEFTYAQQCGEECLKHSNGEHFDLEDAKYYYAPSLYMNRELYLCSCIAGNRFEFSLETQCMGFPKKIFEIRNETIRSMIIQVYKKEMDRDVLLDYLMEYSLEYRMYCQCYDYLQGTTIIQ